MPGVLRFWPLMNWEGTVFDGKYRLGQKLGQGGMGSVWRAEHVQLKSQVAIKLIEQSIATNPEALARFMREAQSAAALRSPHVVQILDHGADHGVPYIAMELLEGESLAQRLERVQRLSPQETSLVLIQTARAITKAHDAGIVHRDLKPDNIFLVRNDDEEVAKVLDFGIAKAAGAAVGPSSSTRTGALLGTPYYMSPEQAEGTRHVDYRTDIWAFGVIAFECLLGRRPFESEAFGSLLLAICTRPLPIPSTYGPVAPGFDAWFAKACAREPERRFASIREAAAEFRKVCIDGISHSMSMANGPTAYSPYSQTPHSHTPHSHTPHSHTPHPHSPHALTPQGHMHSSPHLYPSAPTANPFTASVEPSFRRSRAPLVVGLVIGTAVLALGALGISKLVTERQAEAPVAPPVAAVAPPEPAPVPAPPPPIVEPAAPVALPAPSAAPAVASASAPIATPAPPRTTSRPRPGKAVHAPEPAKTAAAPPPKPAAAPPPPAPPPPAKPKFDLGI